MKKSLIALAVLAASGAALAQSSVTVYGRADIAVGGQKTLTAGSETRAFDGGLTTSRLGFRGTEDLGGGLKANFQLESRINLSNGAYTNATTFHGASTVGLSGGFGQVRAGRMTTVLDDVRGVAYSSNVFDSSFTPASNGVFGSGGDFNSRFRNMLRYDMPSMGGVYGGVNYAFEQTPANPTATPPVAGGDTLIGFMLGYKAGPMNVVLGIQNEKTVNEYMTLAGSYDLGMASISAGYNTRKGVGTTVATTRKDNEFTIGVNVPMGNVNLSAGYATSETKQATGAKFQEADGFGFGATYALSKRTRLYAGYRTHEVKTAAGTKTADTQYYAAGVRHDF
jgi:predicted porin